MFTRNKAETAQQAPPTSESAAIAIEAAVASVKPSTLVAAEIAVSTLRDRRSEIAAELSKVLAETRKRGGDGALPVAATDLQKKIAALDAEIKEARDEMQRRREVFAVEFNRVTGEFRATAREKIKTAMPSIIQAAEILASVERMAMKSGIEVNFVSPNIRLGIDMLRGTLR